MYVPAERDIMICVNMKGDYPRIGASELADTIQRYCVMHHCYDMRIGMLASEDREYIPPIGTSGLADTTDDLLCGLKHMYWRTYSRYINIRSAYLNVWIGG